MVQLAVVVAVSLGATAHFCKVARQDEVSVILQFL